MDKMIADRYMIVSNLGEGGMADVYLAIDTILNREVAIKVLRGELSNDPVTLLRFQREANAASKMNHPNVVDVYDVGEYNKRHYIVMEYVRGRTLKQLISQRGALHKEEAINIMMQLVSAVENAHENNIIHRDIKPQNVLVKDDGTIKITDFGIALAHDAVQLTQSDAVLGSAHYLAPETTRGEPATNQIDIYALGIVFYELLSGTVPFKGDNPVQIAMMHLREEMPSVKDFNPTLPQSIENIITKATVKNKKQRYQNAGEMLEDLKKCLLPEFADVEKLVFEEEGFGEPTMVMESSAKLKTKTENEPTPEPKKDHKKLWISIGIALIAIISAVALYFSGVIEGFSYDPTLIVPEVVNLTKEEAVKKFEAAEFDMAKITFTEELTDDVEAGKVVKVEPDIAAKVKKSEEIKVVISKGTFINIENYIGKNIDDVKKTLADFENIKVTINYKPTKDTTAGIILEQSGLKANDKVDPEKESEIIFSVASAPEFIIPDNIIGKPVEDAYNELKNMGAAVVKERKSTIGLSDAELAELQKGVVIECSPGVGERYIQTNNVITLYFY